MIAARRRGPGSPAARAFLALLSILAASCASPGGADVHSLVDAERAFAADAEARGIPAAFLEVLDESAVAYLPGPTSARPVYEAMAHGPARLTWEPRVAECSSAGDLGFTTGPYTFVPDPDTPASHGHYLSIWRRSGDGPWRLVLDIGTPHPPAPPEPIAFTSARGTARAEVGADDRADLLEIDGMIAPETLDPRDACSAASAPDYRLHVPGRAPVIGREAGCSIRAEILAGFDADPEDAGLAASGDLGFTRGTLRPGPTIDDGREFTYVRLWRYRSDGWARIAEVVLPLAPAPGP